MMGKILRTNALPVILLRLLYWQYIAQVNAVTEQNEFFAQTIDHAATDSIVHILKL